MEVIVKNTYDEMSRAAALKVVNVLNAKPDAVIGLATGSTPLNHRAQMRAWGCNL